MNTEKCINCDERNITSLSEGTSGCSDAPKGTAVIKWVYWCHNCKGIYHIGFQSQESIVRETFD